MSSLASDGERGGIRIGWSLVLAAAVGAAVVVAWHILAVPLSNPFYGLFQNMTDLRVYRAGAQTVLDARPLYGAPVLWRLEFTYPPFAAIVLIPMALLGATAANVVWWLAIYAALVAIVLLGMRSLGYRIDVRLSIFAMLLAVAVTALEPVRTTVWLGQINIFLMLLVLLDVLHPRSRLRGLGVGLAAGLKLTPGFFVVYLLATRRWRAAAVSVVTFAATVLLGFLIIPGDARAYWSRIVSDGASRVGRVDSPANQSINGFISQMLAYFDIRRFSHPAPGGPVFEAPAWLWIPVALVAAALGVWAALIAHRRGNELLAVSIVGMTGATVSPFSWGHHWVWFVPLLLVAIDFAYRAPRSGWSWWRWLVPAAVVAMSFTWWRNWWDSGRWYTSDHAIALGLFMQPRWPDPGILDRLLVILYAGCYPAVLLATIVAVIGWDLRARSRTPDRPVEAHPAYS